MPLLVDIGKIDEACCSDVLEGMYKALSDEGGLAHDIWAEHESPFIRNIVELFTDRGLTRITKVQAELHIWMTGKYYVPATEPVAIPPGFMGRWGDDELDLVRIYLQNIPADAMTIDDWSMAVDYMVQRYLPHDVLNEEAEWLAVKSHMMGRVQAVMGSIDADAAAGLAVSFPSTIEEAAAMFTFSGAGDAVMAYGKAHACDAVQTLSDAARHKIKRVLLAHEAKKVAGEPVSSGSLQQGLQDQFASLNNDWRRIAVTEAGECANQGMVASLPVGTKVRRMEMYRGACPWCKKIDGHIFNVVSPSTTSKDGKKDVWPGKTNIGRSASPYKRVAGALIPRDPSELWWPAAGVQHPHCRGRWDRVSAAHTGDDPEFAAWINNKLGHKEGL